MSALDELVQILRAVVDNPVEPSDQLGPAGPPYDSHAAGAMQPDIREKYQELLQRAVSLQK
ncbi:MAG TPA: hypothetical protein VF053_06820 [Streptosporangiales bacterium]